MLVELSDVKRALDQNELVAYFQPLVNLRLGSITGFEVLSRWQHPKLGTVLPENFMSLAEHNGMMEKLTEQVVRKAFLAFVSFPHGVRLAVNVSPAQLQNRTFPSTIRTLAEETEFPLEYLELEITENALVHDFETALSIARSLKDLGCRLSLDDFGTGHSNLRHLQSLPFDELKIDRSFVAKMTTSRESRKIVAAIVGLGQSLGLRTVAEGVETEEQAAMLLWFGCDLGQGWLYGEAMTADRVHDAMSSPARAQSAQSTKRVDGAPDLRLAQLQAIYEGAPIGLAFLDRQLVYVSLNQRYADLIHAKIKDVVDKRASDVFSEAYPRVSGFLEGALRGISSDQRDTVRSSANPGEPERTTLTTYQPAFDEVGDIIGVSVAVADLTQRSRIEPKPPKTARRSEQGTDYGWVMERGEGMKEASAKWVQITGLTQEQALRWGWLDRVHPDDVAACMRAIRDSVVFQEPIDLRFLIKSKTGEWRWIRSVGYPRYGENGEVIGWSGSTEDLDERSRLETALRARRVRHQHQV